MTLPDIVAGLAILVGLAGILVPVIPGTILILIAVVAWAGEIGGTTAWVCAGLAAALLVVGTVVKYAVPGKRLKATVPTSTLLVGAVLAIVGLFVIPVAGAFVGFPVGVYLAERHRVGAQEAWPSTRAALKAIGASILLEFAFGVAAATTWVVGVVVT